MKRVLQLFVIASLLFCSCKNSSSQTRTETPADMSATILAFYKAYCTEGDADQKTDSILSVYCTDELREYVMDCVDVHDFVLNGRIFLDIHKESFRVVKQNEKYIVSFEYTPWPARDEPTRDSVYVIVNKENKISYIIRPGDNYRIPTSYDRERLYTFDDHEYIDLGLSVNWATANIGTYKSSPEEPGLYYAWGEAVPKRNFDKDYYLKPKQGHYYEGKLKVLESSDDAATILYGEDWRMPTKEEFQELIDKCEWEWTKVDYDQWGYKVTGKNGNSIFLPAGGMITGTRTVNYRDGLYYWTASCIFDDPEREPKAWEFYSVSDGPDKHSNRRMAVEPVPLSRQSGRSIRPVTTKKYIPIRDIVLNRTELKLTIGQEYTLSAAFVPEDANKRNLYWRSGNSAVAFVGRNGKVTAVSGGQCTITAVCGEFRKECQVTVIQPKDYVPVKPEKVATIFRFDNEVNDSFIDDLQDYSESRRLREVFKTHVGGRSEGFDITLSGFYREDRDRDAGDFCLVTIQAAGKEYQFRNVDWVTNDLFENKYFHCIPVDKSRYLLFMRGYDYGCCPGVLTVLAVDKTGARVVYNKECTFDELNKEPFSITIQDWYSEYVSEYKIDYSTAHNLFVEDGALKIKKVDILRE